MPARDALHVNFGRNLRRLRQASSMSQEALAEACGLSRNYISQLELGEKSPSLRVLVLLASALDRAPHELVKAAEET